MIVTRPGVAGVKLKLHEVVPVAVLKVAPPFTDTSTRATVPPPVSLAAPVMLTGVPGDTSAPVLGDVIAEVGSVLSWTVTVTSAGGSCTFPLLSTARLLILAGPDVAGIQLKLHEVVPVAALKVAPPFTDTSTRATVPPPASLAVPVILTAVPVDTVAPGAGDVIAEVGGVVSRTVTVISAGGSCTFPLLSTARLLIDACPGAAGVVHVKLHEVVPVAALKVAPPSTDTSTLATVPPPASLAVPVILTVAPVDTVPPAVGDVIVEVGANLSGVGVGVGMPGRLLVMPHPE